MKLTSLACSGSKEIADLSPLQGMSLTNLQIDGTQVCDLSPLKGMPLTAFNITSTQVSDLSPLKGVPLTAIFISYTQVSDLSPLKGMPLTVLSNHRTLVADLSPLKDLPLQQLWLDFTPDRDTALLRSIKTLETINEKPAAEFCEQVEAYNAEAKRPLAFEAPGFEQWVKETAALPAEQQVAAVSKKLVELNPGFDGKVSALSVEKPVIENEVVKSFGVFTDTVTDISPLRALGSLQVLDIGGSAAGKGKLLNLSPLKGLPLTELAIHSTQVSDLSPLQGMKLTKLSCNSTFFVSDLSPLKGMPLETLDCRGTRFHDLSPLNGMPLRGLQMDNALVSDLSPLQGMKLTHFSGGVLHVTDFSPLKGMPLKEIQMFFKPERDTELLRSIKTLETINGKPVAEFWKEVESKK